MKISVVERGWPAHYICADRCRFRRNTLVGEVGKGVVVSTVGNMVIDGQIDTVAAVGCYYETLAFAAVQRGEYVEADVTKELQFPGKKRINAMGAEDLPANVSNIANAMHDAAVAWFVAKLEGEQ